MSTDEEEGSNVEFVTTEQRVTFVEKVDQLMATGSSITEATKQAGGAEHAADYYVWKSLMEHASQDLDALAIAYQQKPLVRLRKFFTSGLFYMIVGLCLIFYSALYFSKDLAGHSSFTLIFTVLGVAVFLYGTGTQSLGTFSNKNDDVSVSANVRIAGGAGILAILIGYGLLVMQADVRRAFAPGQEFIKINLIDLEKQTNAHLAPPTISIDHDEVYVSDWTNNKMSVVMPVSFLKGFCGFSFRADSGNADVFRKNSAFFAALSDGKGDADSRDCERSGVDELLRVSADTSDTAMADLRAWNIEFNYPRTKVDETTQIPVPMPVSEPNRTMGSLPMDYPVNFSDSADDDPMIHENSPYFEDFTDEKSQFIENFSVEEQLSSDVFK